MNHRFILIVCLLMLSLPIVAQSEDAVITPQNLDQIVLLDTLGRGQVRAIAYSPTGDTMLVGTSIGIWIYDIAQLNDEPRLFIPSDEWVSDLIYCQNPNEVAIKLGNQTVGLWNMADDTVQWLDQAWEQLPCVFSDEPLPKPEFLEMSPNYVYSPDGRFVVSGLWDGVIRIWDVQTEALVTSLVRHELTPDDNEILNLIYSADGQRLMSVSRKHLMIWDIATSTALFNISLSKELTEMATSADLRFITTYAYDEGLQVWDALGGMLILDTDDFMPLVADLTFSPDGERLISLSINVVREWSLETDVIEHFWLLPLPHLSDGISNRSVIKGATELHYLSNNRVIAFSNADPGSTAFVVNPQDLTSTETDPFPNQPLLNAQAIAVYPPRQIVVIGTHDGAILANWNLGDIHQLNGVSGFIAHINYSPDGRFVLLGDDYSQIFIWDVQEDTLAGTITDGYWGTFSPDGTTIAYVDEITVFIYDVLTGEKRHILLGHTAPVGQPIFNPDGTVLVTFSRQSDNTMRFWSTETGDLLHTIPLTGEFLTDIVFSPDGRFIFASFFDGTIQKWGIGQTRTNS